MWQCHATLLCGPAKGFAPSGVASFRTSRSCASRVATNSIKLCTRSRGFFLRPPPPPTTTPPPPRLLLLRLLRVLLLLLLRVLLRVLLLRVLLRVLLLRVLRVLLRLEEEVTIAEGLVAAPGRAAARCDRLLRFARLRRGEDCEEEGRSGGCGCLPSTDRSELGRDLMTLPESSRTWHLQHKQQQKERGGRGEEEEEELA